MSAPLPLVSNILSKRNWLYSTAIVCEALLAGLLLASLAIGVPSLRGGISVTWLLASMAFFAVYLAMALWTAKKAPLEAGRGAQSISLLLVAVLAFGLVVLLVKPQIVVSLWNGTSSIQPFSFLSAATLMLAIWLLKVIATSIDLPAHRRQAFYQLTSGPVIAFALLLLGLFQATVYITFINNPTLRYWAIADGAFLGQGYPLTLTEPGPISAGSPPYVYDLPLFPLVLRVSFAIFGHTSVGVHIPPLIFSVLFPLSLYALIRQATNSRTIGVLFACVASSFPFLRFWSLNLPDPDPFFLTSLCLAAFLYLRAMAAPDSWRTWLSAGLVSGAVALARPEGILYAACFGLGLLLSRPPFRGLVLYGAAVSLFVVPMVAVWMANFGFLWPQNYNRTLALEHVMDTYNLLKAMGALSLYPRGLGMGGEGAVALLVVFVITVLFGTAAAAFRSPRLLPILLPAIGNTIVLFLTHVWISNAFHYADFFRHAAFGIPFMIVASAFAFCITSRWLSSHGATGKLATGLLMVILIAAVIREGDILANPTATHRTGSPIASQALTAYPYLSLQTILEHPLVLPPMSYYHDPAGVLVAQVPGMRWPEDALDYFKPFDMSYDSRGRAFGYASLIAFLIALIFAAVAEGLARQPFRLPDEESGAAPHRKSRPTISTARAQ